MIGNGGTVSYGDLQVWLVRLLRQQWRNPRFCRISGSAGITGGMSKKVDFMADMQEKVGVEPKYRRQWQWGQLGGGFGLIETSLDSPEVPEMLGKPVFLGYL